MINPEEEGDEVEKASSSIHLIAVSPDPSKSIFGESGTGNANRDVLKEVESVRVTTAAKCATWSENPSKSEWEVSLLMSSETPHDLNTGIGFIVLSNLDKNTLEIETNLKLHSRHDMMDLPLFTQLLEKGNYFTKLELEGDFFNNVYLFSEEITPSSVVEFITLPNLKALSIKAKLALILKGLDAETQYEYYLLHKDHCNNVKTRAAKNLWYIFNAFECPLLNTLEIMDCMEWNDQELKECEFYYWSQPLVSFLQRHASTLRSLKATPIVAMQQNIVGQFNNNDELPAIADILFWMKLHLDDFSSVSESQRETKFHIEIEKLLRPWRQFLQSQKELKTLIWITDAQNPWTFTRRDFVELAQYNRDIESLMVAVHGDQQFRTSHGLMELPSKAIKDYQIDATVMHGMASLSTLSIGCYGKDPEMKDFTFINLHLLPSTLEIVQLFGIRVMATDLETLGKLPCLKSLTILQGGRIMYSEQDEVNDNIEGVTASVLKTLLSFARALDKLMIIGFPISEANAGMSTREKKNTVSAQETAGWYGRLFGFFVCNSHLIEDSSSSRTDAPQLVSLRQYSEPLQEIITATAEFANITDVNQDDDDQILTKFTIGI